MSELGEYFEKMGDMVTLAMEGKPCRVEFDECGVLWEALTITQRATALAIAANLVDMFPNTAYYRDAPIDGDATRAN